MNLREAFASAQLLRSISPGTLAMLAPEATLRRGVRGEILFREKEQVGTIYILARGRAAICKTSEDGERRVVFLCGDGQTLNEVVISDGRSSAQCELLRDSLLLCIPVTCALQAMEQDFLFSRAVLDSMAIKIRRLYRQMKNSTGALRGDKRAAAKLWKLARDFGVDDGGITAIDLELSITFLADMLGAKRETVSRQVKLLRQLDLVRHENGRFLIPDCDALRKYFQAP